MGTSFLDDDFLLSTATARTLFHDVAEHLSIVDMHGHLNATDLANDRIYATLTDLWLEDDHYKWRAMRLAGIDETLITGDADPWDRFAAWAATVPSLIRSPLYVWTHLELRRVFGIDLVLSTATAREIWEEASLRLPELSTRALLDRFDVIALATTDDPADDLDAHRRLASDPGPLAEGRRVLPTFRPDAAHALLGDPSSWNAWADRLGATSGVEVTDLDSLRAALAECEGRFAELGCRASDHGLTHVPDVPRDRSLAADAVRRARSGGVPAASERDALLLEVVALAAESAFARESVLQLHLGALRDASPRVRDLVSPDAGADAMGDWPQAPGLVRFLGDLERDGSLPRTILYNANPSDNALFATVAGAFSRHGVRSLVQWGPPWWFNDHEEGLRHHLDVLSGIGQLAGFVGMLTDSRSLLSMTRHELFRRVLCDVVGRDVEVGRIPRDLAWLSTVVSDLCLANAVAYFGLPGAWVG